MASAFSTLERWLYQLLKPVMKAVLRSPLHRMASGTIALLHFRGRKIRSGCVRTGSLWIPASSAAGAPG